MGETDVTPVEIARMAGVGRAAVSNWRRRYEDFPRPIGGTAASPRFALSEVEAWLRRQGKLADVPAIELVWQQVRGLSTGHTLPDAVLTVGALLREEEAYGDNGSGDSAELRQATAALAKEHGTAAALELLLERMHDAIRQPQVPAELARLMVELIGPAPGSVLDPACGTGSLLKAVQNRFSEAELFGVEVDPTLLDLARLRLSAPGRAAVHLQPGGLLQPPQTSAAAVVCAPRAVDRAWDPASNGVAYDPRWAYGLPPRSEPELAWAQHALACLQPGGRAVLLLAPGVSARPSGRRIRAELLRRGALRAIIALPPGAAPPNHLASHLWLLRDPGPEAPADRFLLADLSPTGTAAAASLREAAAVLSEALAALDGGDDFASERPVYAATFRVMDLLDDTVDLTPGRRLHSASGPVDPETLSLLRDRLAGRLDQLRDLLPAVAAATEVSAPLTITVSELARAGALTLIGRSGLRDVNDAGDAGSASEPATAVWRARDVLAGSGPGGRIQTDQVPADAVRVAEGDVLVPAIGHQLTARVVTAAEAGALLGPNLTLLRPEPSMLDPWFVAGFLRRESNAHRTGSLGSIHRFDARRAELPRVPLAEQRRHGELFRQLAQFEEILGAAVTDSGDLAKRLADALAAGTVVTTDDQPAPVADTTGR